VKGGATDKGKNLQIRRRGGDQQAANEKHVAKGTIPETTTIRGKLTGFKRTRPVATKGTR